MASVISSVVGVAGEPAEVTYGQILLMLVVAVLGSSVLTTLINRIYSKKTDEAITHKTEAETADILSQAADRTLQMMHSSMVTAQARILVLEEKVSHLERQVKEYERLHGPLKEAVL
jgi:sensor histidine kinase YesM